MKFKSILKIALTALLWPILSTSSVAQFKDPSTMLSPSPNATSLGLYGEIPISYYTGIPNINIPIKQISGKSIGIDMNLSYHASGIRPNLHPGWVGNGWSLNAGGVITRLQNGLIDEKDTPSNKGFYFSYNNLSPIDWCSDGKIKQSKYYSELVDVEPDIFEFNFQGYSGRFFLDHNCQWQVQCDRQIKVTNVKFGYSFLANTDYLNASNNPEVIKYFQEFTLIDEKGNKYTFGKNEAIEYSDNFYPTERGGSFHATSWFLTDIESASGDETITYRYERGPYISAIYTTINNFEIATGESYWYTNCSRVTSDIAYTGKVTSPVYLKEIEFPQKKIKVKFSLSKSNELSYDNNDYTKTFPRDHLGDDFIPIITHTESIPYYVENFISGSAGVPAGVISRFIWLKLDTITVINTANNNPIQTFALGYNDRPDRRLELITVTSIGANSEFGGKYQLYYNTNVLPNYLKSITDHWGYNNNSEQPLGVNSVNLDQLRAPNESAMRGGILEKIAYPSGGYSIFSYEANRYDSVLSDNRATIIPSASHSELAGGLRVKSIKNVDGNGVEQIKDYYYVMNYEIGTSIALLPSSGLLEVTPRYYFRNIYGVDDKGMEFTYNFVSSNPVIPLTKASTGNHVGYKEVVEKRSDGSYTVYKFTDHHSGNIDDAPMSMFNQDNLPSVPYSSRAVERGKLYLRTMYNASGIPVNEEHIEYARFGGSASRSVFNNNFKVCNNDYQARRNCFTRAAYYNYSYKYLPVKVRNTTWNNHGQLPIVESTQINYNLYGDIESKNVLKSNGEENIRRYKYTGDIDCNQLYRKLELERNQCIEMAQETFSNCRINCSNQSGSGDLPSGDCNELCEAGLVAEENNCNTYFFAKKNELESKYMGIFKTMQDRNMLSYPVEELSVIKRNGTEYLTGGVMTKYKDFGAGVIMPWESYRLNLSQPLATFSPAHVGDDGSFISQPEYTKEASYTFTPKATLAQQEQVGQPIASYLWDAAGEHPIAKAINAPSGTWLHESFEEGGFNKERQDFTTFKTGKSSTRACLVDWSNTKTINLEAGRKYSLSYWTKKGTTSSQARVSVSKTGLDLIHLMVTPPATGDWMLAEGTFTVPAGQGGEYTVYVLSGGGNASADLTQYSYIDDVRIAPTDAQVTSYTWEPGVGITSQTDPLGLTTTYEYDGLGRLIRVRDSEGKVIQEHRYKYATEQ